MSLCPGIAQALQPQQPPTHDFFSTSAPRLHQSDFIGAQNAWSNYHRSINPLIGVFSAF
jgi:hypothetical protein